MFRTFKQKQITLFATVHWAKISYELMRITDISTMYDGVKKQRK